jgi:hypothetical protein
MAELYTYVGEDARTYPEISLDVEYGDEHEWETPPDYRWVPSDPKSDAPVVEPITEPGVESWRNAPEDVSVTTEEPPAAPVDEDPPTDPPTDPPPAQ